MNRFLLILGLMVGFCHGSVVSFTQCSMSGGQWARLVVALKNRGPGALQAPRAAFDLKVPAGKTPEGQGWDVGSVTVSVERKSDTIWTVWLTSSADLAEGTTWNDGRGALLGVHLTDWSAWDASASPSWIASTENVENSALRVYDAAGQLVGGQGAVVTPVATHSTFALQIDPGGACNVTGNAVVAKGAPLSVRCVPDGGMRLSGWVLDGVGHNASETMDFVADGADHNLQIHFSARTRYWVTTAAQGQGSVTPSGDVAVYEGDTLKVAATATAGWSFSNWTLDGSAAGSAPVLTIDAVSKSSAVTAVFRQDVLIASLQLWAMEELPRDPHWSKIRVKVANAGTTTLESGYKVRYLFRVPAHEVPSLSTWGVPSANASLTELGNGYWAADFVSTTLLAPGSVSGEGRGWYFALQTGTNTNWDTTGNIALPSGGAWANAPFISLFDKNGNRIAGSDPSMSASYPDGLHVMALFKEGDGDDKMLRPRIVIRNYGSQALSDFVYYWYFRTDSAKVPIITPWYPDSVRPALEALGNGNYRLRFDYSGATLPPQTDLPTADGSVTGIYLAGYPSWDKTKACSYMSGSTFQPDSAILIYDRAGKLLWGKPDAVKACGGDGTGTGDDTGDDDTGSVIDGDVGYPPVIVVQPRDTTVREGSSARFEVRATGEGDLSYQWRRNGADIIGATDPLLDLDLVVGSQDGDEFLCVVSNGHGSVVSGKVHLGVVVPEQATVIVSQPSDDTTSIGGDASFAVVVSSGEALRYQWYFNGQPLRGKNSARFVINAADVRDSGAYWVVVTTASGKRLVSRHAVLVLVPARPSALVLSISGVFADSIRSQLPDTSADLIVRLFGTPKGGDALWIERHLEVPIHSGEWNLTIGSDPNASGLDALVQRHSGLYLEIALDGVLPIAFGPRVPLTSVPYATAAGARVIYGQGIPVQSALEGVLYLDQTTKKLWQRKGGIWVRLDS